MLQGMGFSTAMGAVVPPGTPQSVQGTGVNASVGLNGNLGVGDTGGVVTILALFGAIVVAYWGTRRIQGLK